ncbi:MAG: restriction endonuclease subunit S [Cyclobacteriaceae bacterium]
MDIGTTTPKQPPRYPAYQDSGVEWLGEIPEHWELTRLGTRFFERREKVSDKDFEPLSVTKNGVLPQLDNAAKTNDGDNRKLVRSGDFVINSRSDRKGSSGIADRDGSVSLINIVLEPRGIDPMYCNFLLKGNGFIEEFYRNGHGIVADLWTTRYSEMKTIMLGVPPLEEQKRIADFLDRKVAQLDQAIAQKEQLIALLKERRQVLIHRAVTRGLDPHAPMQDSGIDWIGEIPAHWEVKKLKHVNKVNPSVTIDDLITEVSFVPMESVGEGGGIDTSTIRPLKDVQKGFTAFQDNDIVVAKITPCYENYKGAIVSGLKNGVGFGTTELHVLRPSKTINKEFIFYVTLSPAFRNAGTGQMYGSGGQKRIGTDWISNVQIPVPPIKEQLQIVESIEKRNKKTTAIVSQHQTQIQKLKEYKATLINAAVTGKIRV